MRLTSLNSFIVSSDKSVPLGTPAIFPFLPSIWHTLYSHAHSRSRTKQSLGRLRVISEGTGEKKYDERSLLKK